MTELQRPEEGDIYFLEPRSTRVKRNSFGRLVLTIGAGVEEYVDVRPVRAFPLSAPEHDISLMDTDGKEIGVITDLGALDAESQRVLRDELELIYLSTRVLSIVRVESRYGVGTWELETDRGPRTCYVRDRGDVRPMPDGRIILTDIHGVKYEIPPMSELDERSRAFIEGEM